MDLLVTINNPLKPESKRILEFRIIASLIFIGFVIYEFKMLGRDVSIFTIIKDEVELDVYQRDVNTYVRKNSNVWQTYLIIPVIL